MGKALYSLLAVLAISGILFSACGSPQASQSTTYLPKVLAPSEKAADLVLINSKIITVDAKDSIVQAVAVKNGKIVKVGLNQEVGDLIGAQTDVLDLKGKTVTPGLIDAHCHPSGWARFDKRVLNLSALHSKEELLKLVADKAKTTPKGEWIAGKPFPGGKNDYPNRWELDAVAPDNPVFLSDGPSACTVANSYALKFAACRKSLKISAFSSSSLLVSTVLRSLSTVSWYSFLATVSMQ